MRAHARETCLKKYKFLLLASCEEQKSRAFCSSAAGLLAGVLRCEEQTGPRGETESEICVFWRQKSARVLDTSCHPSRAGKLLTTWGTSVSSQTAAVGAKHLHPDRISTFKIDSIVNLYLCTCSAFVVISKHLPVYNLFHWAELVWSVCHTLYTTNDSVGLAE